MCSTDDGTGCHPSCSSIPGVFPEPADHCESPDHNQSSVIMIDQSEPSIYLTRLSSTPVQHGVPLAPVIVQGPLVWQSPVKYFEGMCLEYNYPCLTLMGTVSPGATPPLMNTSWPLLVCFSTNTTVLFTSPGLEDSVVVEDVPEPDVVVPGDVGPGVGPGPEPSHPTQIANIPS